MTTQEKQQSANSSQGSTGTPWQFRFIIIVIAIGIIGIIGKALGLF
jgi:hypothetical protein